MNTIPSENNPKKNSDWPLRSFLNLAGLLICAQVFTGFLAIGLGAFFKYDQDLDSIEKSIFSRLGELSNELEQRAFPPGGSEFQSRSMADLQNALILDLSTRFPDPLVLLDSEGQILRTIQPDHSVFRNMNGSMAASPLVPKHIDHALRGDQIQVNLKPQGTLEQVTWASAPVYNAEGSLVGGLLIQPLTNTIDIEFRRSRQAWINAAILVFAFSIIFGFMLSAFITHRYVREDVS